MRSFSSMKLFSWMTVFPVKWMWRLLTPGISRWSKIHNGLSNYYLRLISPERKTIYRSFFWLFLRAISILLHSLVLMPFIIFYLVLKNLSNESLQPDVPLTLTKTLFTPPYIRRFSANLCHLVVLNHIKSGDEQRLTLPCMLTSCFRVIYFSATAHFAPLWRIQ